MNCHCTLDSPIGRLLLTSDGEALTGLHFDVPGREPRLDGTGREDAGEKVLALAAAQLREYFAGRRLDFALPLRLHGTDFQRRVWQQLQIIPYGATWSYGDLAKRLDSPGASRAVGLANGRNPIAIVVPCHRVIGANGALTGFGGGIERKRWLLTHEAGGPFELR
jgi:methylated-DNA-[protein]-cysteine S-methyltransferase